MMFQNKLLSTDSKAERHSFYSLEHRHEHKPYDSGTHNIAQINTTFLLLPCSLNQIIYQYLVTDYQTVLQNDMFLLHNTFIDNYSK